MLNWIVWNRTILYFETVLILNYILWNRTIWLNYIAWNWNVFWQLNCVLMLNWFIEIELFICKKKMDLALNNLQKLICHKPKLTNKQVYIYVYTHTRTHTHIYIYYTEVYRRALLYSIDSSTLPLIRTWVLSGIKYDFLSLWYDSTWDWTPFSRTTGEYPNHYANGPVKHIHT